MGHEHKYMKHETVNWGVRGLGYMLFNVYLCNQPYYREVVVGPGTHLCTLLEVWVLRGPDPQAAVSDRHVSAYPIGPH
jgi:hypothetical protein